MLSVMNPPKGKKKPSAKQIAARKKFAARYGGKKGKAGGGGSSSSSSSKKGRKVKSSKRKGSGVPRSGSKKRRGFGGGGNMFKSLARGGVAGTIQGVGALGGFAAVSKLPDYLPDSWLRDADGTVPTWKRFAAKIGTAAAVFLPLHIAGHMVKGKAGAMLKGAAEASLAGGVVNIGYDALNRMTKGKILPTTLSGGVAGGEMGQMLFNQLTQQPGSGMGLYANAGANFDPAYN